MNKTEQDILKFVSEHPNSDTANVSMNTGYSYEETANALYKLHFQGYVRANVRNGSKFTITNVGKAWVEK